MSAAADLVCVRLLGGIAERRLRSIAYDHQQLREPESERKAAGSPGKQSLPYPAGAGKTTFILAYEAAYGTIIRTE
jgi:hypothetical protein